MIVYNKWFWITLAVIAVIIFFGYNGYKLVSEVNDFIEPIRKKQ